MRCVDMFPPRGERVLQSRREQIAFLATEFLLLAGNEFTCCFRGDRSVLSRQNSIRQGAHRER